MAESWESLRAECLACRGCGLAAGRTNVVFGAGAEDAKILLVGEGPGRNEDEQGVAFVGKAGQLLDDMLELIGLDRTRVYIANIIKCRPPDNRDPLPEERAACVGYLRRQIALLEPRLIVCLGRIAAQELIEADFKITKEHGQWFDRAGVPVTATYHPAALLRDDRKRPEAFRDLKRIQAKARELGLI